MTSENDKVPQLFSSTKYILRVTARPTTATIPEAEENASMLNSSTATEHSEPKLPKPKHGSESSTDSTEISTSSVGKSTSSCTTTSRMENGKKIPRLIPGVYYKKPTPILGTHLESDFPPDDDESVAFVCSPYPEEMRGPPPSWQPPCPPDKPHDYENNYEDPEELRNSRGQDGSRDLLLATDGPHNGSTFNSYEMSLSQQRRSNNTMLNGQDDWGDNERNRVLHKNAEGSYYIPGGSASLRTTTSTLSPASQIRYQDSCMPGLPRKGVDPASASLLKYPTTTTLTGTHINKKRASKMPYASSEKEDSGCSSSAKRFPLCIVLLAAALLFALILIAILLMRSPSYVYVERSPSSPAAIERRPFDETQLRPLPAVVYVGQRVEADLVPNHMAGTELVISRPARVQFNFTLGAGAQVVLLGRHSVPPSLYIHDFFKPLRSDQVAQKPSHRIEDRTKRHVYEIVDARPSTVEEFLMEGRWHLMLVNERNRVEPLSLMISPVEAPTQQENPLQPFLCDQNCNGHGECVSGKCRCSAGFTGDACEDPVCPVVCSGNGVFSGGACVCKAGFKGKECDIRSTWCEVPDCSGHGRCSSEGYCICHRGWTGTGCHERDCPNPTCNDNGVCVRGKCFCVDGWTGADCRTSVAEAMAPRIQYLPITTEPIRRDPVPQPAPTTTSSISEVKSQASTTSRPPLCVNGRVESGICLCFVEWSGPSCEIDSCQNCLNGVCDKGTCACYPGWRGANCDSLKCAQGCEEHGICHSNGTCTCQKGWNGDNCYSEGCPASCNGGECSLGEGVWQCSCPPDRTGPDCSVPLELDCNDGLDNDNDGLVDCDDPECCAASQCSERGSCVFSANPMEVLLRLNPHRNAEFSQRVSFVYQNDIQKYADPSKFNASLVSLIRGRVTWDGGVAPGTHSLPLVGVRVSDSHMPLWGFTLSRIDGEFDLVVNGGQTIQLRFQRNPFTKSVLTRYVEPNSIVHIGDVRMYMEKRPRVVLSSRVQCSLATRTIPSPTILPSWQLGTASVAQRGFLIDSRSVVEQIPIPGSSVHLVYDSSRVSASHSWVVLGLLGGAVDENLRLIHVLTKVAGRRYQERLSPSSNLTYTWHWDKQNVFQQSEHGLIRVNFKIGYEYKGCDRDSEIAWIHRSVLTEGAGSRILEGSAWSLSIHHHLDVVNNVLEMGGGGRRFLAVDSPKVEILAGTQAKRELDCASCEGMASKLPLLRPSVLALGVDGSVFVGDNELIRRIQPNGHMNTVLKFSMADTSNSYHLAVNPLDGSFYVSMTLRKCIWKVAEMEPEDVTANYEVVVGDGTSCTSHSSSCGDGGPATQAQLYMPKGITFDADGNLYVADGRRVRIVDLSGSIRSISGQPSGDGPPRCAFPAASLADVQLEWPTALSVHKPSGVLYVLDSNVVYEINPAQGTAKILLGVLSSCPNVTSPALHSAKDISVAADGSIYIAESDGKHVNQIRRFSSQNGLLEPFAGQSSTCSCDVPSCDCDDSAYPSRAESARFNAPSAVDVDVHGNVIVADSGNAKVKKIVRRTASYDNGTRLYTVVDSQKNEIYAFNRHGLHAWTQSINTGKVLYNFTYNVDTSLGRLSSIHGAGDLLFRVIRTNETHTTLETPNGRRSQLVLSVYDGTMDSVKTDGYEPVKLQYANGGLLKSRVQAGKAVVYEYDEMGRGVRAVRDGEEFKLLPDRMNDGRYITEALRNNLPYATFTKLNNEVVFTDAHKQRLLTMGDAQLLYFDGVTSLLDKQAHPVHGEPTVLKVKTTVAGIEEPSRRDLTLRFDWRPFVKRGTDRMVAEINGIGAYTTAFDRSEARDVIRMKHNEDELLRFTYADSGEIRSIGQKPTPDSDYTIANMTVSFDSLGRRSSIRWGNISIQATYDRQNRIVERTGAVSRNFAYQKDQRTPVAVILPGAIKYSLKYDSRGRLRDVTTPIGEVHAFSTLQAAGDTVMFRRYPFTKKPFRVTRNGDGEVIEWTTADDLHQEISASRDQYHRLTESICDASSTTFEYLASSSSPSLIRAPFLIQNVTRQGHLTVATALSHFTQNRWVDSSVSLEYDDLFRPVAYSVVLGGTALEPIQLAYDERSALANEISGYQMLAEGDVLRIQGHKTLYETTFDSYRLPESVKIVVGDVRITLNVKRDTFGRIASTEWSSPRGSLKETYDRNAQGKLTQVSSNEKRWLMTYNNDGRQTTVGDAVLEWHAGGVVKRVGNSEYLHDANGWVVKRGAISFEYDCQGRLSGARDAKATAYRFTYDHLGRLSWMKKGNVESTFFYAHVDKPNFISHLMSSDGKISTFYPTEEGRPFAMTRDGFRYAVVTDVDGSLRFIASESGVVKEINRGPFGNIIFDSDPAFWLPFGFRGGVEIPELSIVLINGRPFDTVAGRFTSFGATQAAEFSMARLPDLLDLFALPEDEGVDIPFDASRWFELSGLSPRVLPDVHLPPPSASLGSRSFGSLPSDLLTFSSPLSVSPSELLEHRRILPSESSGFVSEETGFSDLLILATTGNSTIMEPVASLTADERNLLTPLFLGAQELPFRQWSAGSERHFFRPTALPSITSETKSHFTVVASKERVELRSGKAKIIVHFGVKEKVMASLVDELKKREVPSVWRAEKRRLERGEELKRAWTETEARDLLSKGSVPGFDVSFDSRGNPRFPTVHQWRFVHKRA